MADDSSTPKGKHRGPAHSSPYPVSRLGAPISLVDVAREIEVANDLIRATTSSELLAIAKQIRDLQSRARDVLERAEQDVALHSARCNFKRIVGKTYHLYRKADGERFFSMLSPEDWGGQPPHSFEGSYRLEADQRWTPADQAEQLDEERRALLGGVEPT